MLQAQYRQFAGGQSFIDGMNLNPAVTLPL
jgi:hypothetical protein